MLPHEMILVKIMLVLDVYMVIQTKIMKEKKGVEMEKNIFSW